MADTDRSIGKALQVVERFREFDPELPSEVISAFLHIALTPRITQEDLKNKLGLASSSVTRNIDRLSTVIVKDSGARGFGLVEREEGQDRRTKELRLTKKGQSLLAEIVHTIEHGG